MSGLALPWSGLANSWGLAAIRPPTAIRVLPLVRAAYRAAWISPVARRRACISPAAKSSAPTAGPTNWPRPLAHT